MKLDQEQIDEIFCYHRPFGSQPARYVEIRTAARAFAMLLDRNCPNSREKSLAITSLQQAVMWANAAIAINETEPAEQVDAI
jgi:hypothetical protein